MTTLYANPYDISANGFYFETMEDYRTKAEALRNDYGEPVEEFEIEFIDGDEIDCTLAKAWGLYQSSFAGFFDACEDWDEEQKRRYIIAVGECGYSFDPAKDTPDQFDVDIYECASLRELAEQLIDEGLLRDIPEHLCRYIDYDAIARDLGMDYSETVIAGTRLIYRCA